MVNKKTRSKSRRRKRDGGGKIECDKFMGFVNLYGTCWFDAALTSIFLSDNISNYVSLRVEQLKDYYEGIGDYLTPRMNFYSYLSFFYKDVRSRNSILSPCDSIIPYINKEFNITKDKRLLFLKMRLQSRFEDFLEGKTQSGNSLYLLFTFLILLDLDFKYSCYFHKKSFCSKCLSYANCSCDVIVWCICDKNLSTNDKLFGEKYNITIASEKKYYLNFILLLHRSEIGRHHSSIIFKCDGKWYLFDAYGKGTVILLDQKNTENHFEQIFESFNKKNKIDKTIFYNFYFLNMDELSRRKSIY